MLSGFGQAVLCAAVAGVQAGCALRGLVAGWGWKGALQQMFPVQVTGEGGVVGKGGGGEGEGGGMRMRDERTGDLSSPLAHTSLSRHVSVSGGSIWWPSAPADPPCVFLRRGLAAARAGTSHFGPPPPAKCVQGNWTKGNLAFISVRILCLQLCIQHCQAGTKPNQKAHMETHTHTRNCTLFSPHTDKHSFPLVPRLRTRIHPQTHITQPLQFIPFVTHGWPPYSYDQRGTRRSQAERKGASGVASARMEGRLVDWSSVWPGSGWL